MVRVTINPSRALAVLLIVVHLGTAAVLVPLDLALWVKVSLALCVATSLAHSLCRHALLKTCGSVTGIELGDRSNARVLTRDGHWREADVLGTTYVSSLFTVLNLRLKASRLARHVLLVPDNSDSEDFRRLRVVLRWGNRKRTSAR